MAEPQLSIRSEKARTLAKKFAKEDHRSITRVVEMALELYGDHRKHSRRESADDFWDRLVRENHVESDPDIDLEAIIKANRKPHNPIEL